MRAERLSISLEDAGIDAYIVTGDPFDKAGSYAIQHPVFRPVDHLEGCRANVVGLPLCHLAELLNCLEVNFVEEAVQGCRSGQHYKCRLVENIRAMDASEY